MSPRGKLCNSKQLEINNEIECEVACIELSYNYKGNWNDSKEFPNCSLSHNGRCHFNTSPGPGQVHDAKYHAICKKHIESGKINITFYVLDGYCLNH